MAKKGGQNKVWCAKYKTSGRREVAKARRLLRHLFNCSGEPDTSAMNAKAKFEKSIVDRARRELSSGARLWKAPA